MQKLLVFLPAQGPLRRRLIEQHFRGGRDARHMCAIGLKSLHQRVHRLRAHIFVMNTSHEIVEHAFAQRAVGYLHALDAEFLKCAERDRAPAREHRTAIVAYPEAGKLIDPPKIDQRRPQFLQAGPRNAIVAPAMRGKRIGNREQTARGADCGPPALGTKGFLDRFELLARRNFRRAQSLGIDPPVAEIAFSHTDAAHVQAFHCDRLVMLADDEFGATTTDIHHQAQPAIFSKPV